MAPGRRTPKWRRLLVHGLLVSVLFLTRAINAAAVQVSTCNDNTDPVAVGPRQNEVHDVCMHLETSECAPRTRRGNETKASIGFQVLSINCLRTVLNLFLRYTAFTASTSHTKQRAYIANRRQRRC